MTPKPLSKEEKAEVPRLTDEHRRNLQHICITPALLDALLAAESFWREAVKKIPDPYDAYDSTCPLCDATCPATLQDSPHEPDCPWRLAQE